MKPLPEAFHSKLHRESLRKQLLVKVEELKNTLIYSSDQGSQDLFEDQVNMDDQENPAI